MSEDIVAVQEVSDPAVELTRRAVEWFEAETADDRKELVAAEASVAAIPTWRKPWRLFPWAWATHDWGDRILLGTILLMGLSFAYCAYAAPPDAKALLGCLAGVCLSAVSFRLWWDIRRIRHFRMFVRKRASAWPGTDDEKVMAYLRCRLFGRLRGLSVDTLFDGFSRETASVSAVVGPCEAGKSIVAAASAWRERARVVVAEFNAVIRQINRAYETARSSIDGWPTLPPAERPASAARCLETIALADEAWRLQSRFGIEGHGGLTSLLASAEWTALAERASRALA